MKKNIFLIFLTVLTTLILNSQLGYLPAYVSSQNLETPRLSAQEVLSIIARPLPANTPRGFFLVNVELQDANLAGIDLTRAQLDFSNFSSTTFNYGVLTNASATYSNFANCSFGWADLEGANLSYSDFTSANFTGANLRNASLGEVGFVSANFSNTSLSGASFYASDLTDAEFLGAVLDGTILPDGTTYEAGRDLMKDFGTASNP